MTKTKLGKNQLAVLHALAVLPANQAPHQIYEEMRNMGYQTARTTPGTVLSTFFKKGLVKRQGIRGAYYYTITQLGQEALKAEGATIKSSGQGDRIPF